MGEAVVKVLDGGGVCTAMGSLILEPHILHSGRWREGEGISHSHLTTPPQSLEVLFPQLVCLYTGTHSHTHYQTSATWLHTSGFTRMSSTPREKPCSCKNVVKRRPRAESSWLATPPPYSSWHECTKPN